MDHQTEENIRLARLLEKFLQGRCTQTEKDAVENWYARYENRQADQPSQELIEGLYFRIEEHLPATSAVRQDMKAGRFRTRGLRAAAAVAATLLLAVAATYIWQAKDTGMVTEIPAGSGHPYKNDVAPGGNKAMLILADGSRIALDDARDGLLAQQENSVISKTGDGSLQYRSGTVPARPGQTMPVYNTLSTPQGGQYRVTLPDSTRVWLNAKTTLRYPASFTGTERQVELSGEAYFEVAHQPDVPFKVTVDGKAGVEVLGTQFNIMAYRDEEAVRTTLLEGSVRVTNLHTPGSGQPERTLTPGWQATIDKRIQVSATDTEEAIAWKNGLTSFRNADIKTIMRQVSRWYDVEVEYRGRIPERLFTGEVSREAPLSELLQILELSGINFEIEGRKVTVFP